MYAGRIACCPLVSHGKYADGTDRQTDGRQTVTVRFPLYAATVIIIIIIIIIIIMPWQISRPSPSFFPLEEV